MVKKIFFFTILVLTTSYVQAKEYYDILYINLIFDGKRVYLNPKEFLNLDIIDVSPALTIGGDYKIEYYNDKNNLIVTVPVNLNIGENYLYIPYLLNAGYLVVKDKNGIILGKIDLKIFEICNENNICEPGEENLCPLDCPSANNPNYPLASPLKELQVEYKPYEEKVTPQKELKELKEVTPTIALPEKSFSYIASITIIIFGIIFILGVLIYLKFKK